jgi:putative sugar O-methyltransferase
MEERLVEFFKFIKQGKNQYKYNEVHEDGEKLLEKTLNENSILNFRNNINSYLSGALSFPDQNRGVWFNRGILLNYFSNLKFLYFKKKKMKRYLKSLKIKYIDNLEDNIGEPIIYKFFNFEETGTNLSNNFYNSLFDYYIKKYHVTKLIEVGGGFGKLASKICQENLIDKYSIIELTMTSAIAYYYLKEKFKNSKKIEFFFDKDETLNNVDLGDINIFSTDFLAKNSLNFLKVDMLINTESFMHMSEHEIMFYVNIIKSNKIKYVLTINRLEKKRVGEAEFDKIFQNNNIKLKDRIDLSSILEGMELVFYENPQ